MVLIRFDGNSFVLNESNELRTSLEGRDTNFMRSYLRKMNQLSELGTKLGIVSIRDVDKTD